MFFEYPNDFTNELSESENYNLIMDNIIRLHNEFFGLLNVPVAINNGFSDSDIFNIEILVDQSTQINDFENTISKIYYDGTSK